MGAKLSKVLGVSHRGFVFACPQCRSKLLAYPTINIVLAWDFMQISLWSICDNFHKGGRAGVSICSIERKTLGETSAWSLLKRKMVYWDNF
jgi:hypothetical protein